MTNANMDPDAVLEYKEHLSPRAEALQIYEALLATDAPETADLTDIESGLIPKADWFGPDALWTEDVTVTLEMVYFHRASEAVTGNRLISDLQETLQLFVDRWREDEETISNELDSLTSELEDWKG
ncbi:hypothetical protein [Glycomyces salinus]|uniref:hypothetical protein n=1 Tax=Glycomyces salinus TaxID=980294 RepID=UPI0018ECA418|nr:hypothetical protein [Glycomyces salinus]